MDKDLELTGKEYVNFFETLSAGSVEDFRKFASPEVRYKDPFHDAIGIEAAVEYLHSWFKNLDDIRFDVHSYAIDGRIAFSHWLMTFRFKRLPKKLWELDGVSKVVFDERGKVLEQIDYWDSAPMLEYFPVLGRIVSFVKNQYSG